MTKKTRNTNLYITPETHAKIARLLAMLTQQGVEEVVDNRGHGSISALFRYLVDAELRRLMADPDAPFPDADPLDEMGVFRK